MKVAEQSRDEARLDALCRYEVFGTPPEEAFDDLGRAAAVACRTPMAIVALVGGQSVWLKARVGIQTTEIPRESSCFANALLGIKLLVVRDAKADDRFAGDPLVTAETRVRFFAGVPLVTPEGHSIGTLAVMDRTPRLLKPSHEEVLRILARRVIGELDNRRRFAVSERTTKYLVHHLGRVLRTVTGDDEFAADAPPQEFQRSAF